MKIASKDKDLLQLVSNKAGDVLCFMFFSLSFLLFL